MVVPGIVASQALDVVDPAVGRTLEVLVTLATGIYSMRLVNPDYSGQCCRVRKPSGGAEQDIGFTGGYMDTAALLTFAAGADVDIITWYNQAQPGMFFPNAAASTSLAPRIATGGVFDDDIGGNQVPVFALVDSDRMFSNASPAMITTEAAAIFVVARADAVQGSGVSDPDGGSRMVDTGNGRLRMCVIASGASYGPAPCLSVSAVMEDTTSVFADVAHTPGSDAIYVTRFDYSEVDGLKVYANGGVPGTAQPTSPLLTSMVGVGIGNGKIGGGTPWDGLIGEVLIWDQVVSIPEANTIGNWQSDFWGPAWTDIVEGEDAETSEAVGSATGAGAGAGVGAATVAAVGTASGTSAGGGESILIGAGAGAATGTGTGTAVGASTVAAVGSASGTGALIAIAPELHRYWMLETTENQSGALTAISELELYATEFGGQQATGGTASADSETGGHTAAQAFNGDIRSDSSNVWASGGGALPHWLAYDFGSGNAVEVLGVGIHARWGGDVSQAPKDFNVRYSDDGSAWTTHWSIADLVMVDRVFQRFVKSGSEDSYSGSPHGAHSHWRILVEEIDAGTLVSIAEAEYRATPSGADQATGGTAVASSEFDGSFVAANAFDGSGATAWAASGSRGWLRYDFASPVSVAEVSITARSSDEGQPKTLALQWADSTSGPWTTAWMPSSLQTGWTASETRTFTDPNYV